MNNNNDIITFNIMFFETLAETFKKTYILNLSVLITFIKVKINHNIIHHQ